MKILLNPKIGAIISDVQIKGQKYFPEGWEVNSVKKFEDDEVARVLQDLYGFLVEFSLEEAEQYLVDEKKKKYACEKCDYVGVSEELLKKHLEKHIKDEELEKSLGLETVKTNKNAKPEGDKDIQAGIDAQSKKEGLIGGLVDETRPVKARF